MCVCIIIASVSYFILGSIMVFAPQFLGNILLDGDEPINIAAGYFKLCGAALFTVDFLFVFRSCVQGLGRPLIPMLSGIVEMVMRVGVIIIFIKRAGFMATSFAEIAAWTGALTMNVCAYFYITRKKLELAEELKKDGLLSLGEIAQRAGFSSPTALHRASRKVYGTEFRLTRK
jgi:Na+-driven multidrug efflux pump